MAAMTSSGLTTAVLSRVYRPLTRRAAKEILEGRAWDLAGQARRRWLSSDVDEFLRAAWERVEELLPGAELERLPNLGNRHNVFLAVVTTAAYQALCAQGMSRDYAATLIADLGFKIYSRMLAMAALRLDGRTLGARARMSRALRGLLRFPFSAPGAPGYAVRAWEDADGFHTHWTHCPPQSFVRRLIERDGDHGGARCVLPVLVPLRLAGRRHPRRRWARRPLFAPAHALERRRGLRYVLESLTLGASSCQLVGRPLGHL
ncbi:MAG: hypothetical protein IPI67_23855 [Myxococcales bacterium]|nr:hypothetical protein [Myxococcales bacterium]